jgi:hypothetical protein
VHTARGALSTAPGRCLPALVVARVQAPLQATARHRADGDLGADVPSHRRTAANLGRRAAAARELTVPPRAPRRDPASRTPRRCVPPVSRAGPSTPLACTGPLHHPHPLRALAGPPATPPKSRWTARAGFICGVETAVGRAGKHDEAHQKAVKRQRTRRALRCTAIDLRHPVPPVNAFAERNPPKGKLLHRRLVSPGKERLAHYTSGGGRGNICYGERSP